MSAGGRRRRGVDLAGETTQWWEFRHDVVVIVTTTNAVEGYRITRYLAPIASNIVAGTGLFSDFVASFSDVFGGRSETYQRQLSDMYARAVKELQRQGGDVGANCVVGATFDFGEIAGKGMQMFMLSAVGTPVVIKTDEQIAAEAAAEEQAVKDRQRREAERRERFAGATSLQALLADPGLAKEARDVRRIYGRSTCINFLRRKAAEVGLGDIEITEDDLPETF